MTLYRPVYVLSVVNILQICIFVLSVQLRNIRWKHKLVVVILHPPRLGLYSPRGSSICLPPINPIVRPIAGPDCGTVQEEEDVRDSRGRPGGEPTQESRGLLQVLVEAAALLQGQKAVRLSSIIIITPDYLLQPLQLWRRASLHPVRSIALIG